MLSIILSALPILGKLIPEGRTPDIISAGVKAAQDVFGTADESEVKAKMAADPALAEQFKSRLEAETAELQARLADLQDARATTVRLVEQGSAIAWGAVVVSVLVVLGFLGMAILLMFRQVPDSQLAIVVFTTLSTGFGMVLQYWLGSSSGSANKDQILKQIATGAAPSLGQVASKAIDAAKTAVKR